MTAFIDGKEVDGGQANDISYEVGSDKMIDGLDEKLIGMKAGDVKTFETQLVGQQEGEKGEVTATVKAVKERELPPVDDAFAKLASEFDTLAELKADFVTRLERVKKMEQGAQARDRLVEKLLADNEIPVPDNLVELEVNDHLEGEGRLEDKAHRAEVTEQSARSFKVQMLLDAIAEAEELKVSEQELIQYLMQAAQQYGMDINEFIKVVDQNGQIPMFVAEVARRKALAVLLEAATVVDTKGKKVDLEDFLKTDDAGVEDHTGHDHD
jgi:trigger factor